MKREYASAVIFFLLGVWACALTGCGGGMYATIKTGYDTADRYTQQTTANLSSGSITPAQAKERLGYIKDAKACLDKAKATATACPQPPDAKNCPTAQISINCADAALTSVLGSMK